MRLSDSYYMGLALAAAEKARREGEVPVGAVVVADGEIYSAQWNERETRHDPTAHAEILAIRHAAERRAGWRLPKATLYVTAEPCLLCTGAIYLARIPRVVFGCPNPKGGALRFVARQGKKLRLNHSVKIVGGVREAECATLLKDFFRERRKPAARRDGRVVEGA
jgi:tRNA(adenine34) deaminase